MNFLFSYIKQGTKFALLLFVFLLHSVALNAANTNKIDELRIAFWNVENLFDTVVNGPSKHKDEDFTPSSWRRWTPQRYSQKLDHLAHVINAMKPDVIGMAEVENLDVLEDLNKRLKEKYGWQLPYIGHIDSSDVRGIDQAVMSKYPIKSTHLVAHTYGRRGSLVVVVDVKGEPITFMVNHWKSPIGNYKENMKTRAGEATALREELAKRYKRDRDMSFGILGDFNEDCDDVTMLNSLKVSKTRNQTLKHTDGDLALYHLAFDLPKNKRGTYYYARRSVWNSFDGIIVPATLLGENTSSKCYWRVKDKKSYQVFVLPEMKEPGDGRPRAFRRVRIKGKPNNYYEEGYSDHFPVLTILVPATEIKSEASPTKGEKK